MRDLLAEEEGEEVDYGTDELEADEVTPEADSNAQILEVRDVKREASLDRRSHARISWGEWRGSDQPRSARRRAGSQARDRLQQQSRELDVDVHSTRRRSDERGSRMLEPDRARVRVRSRSRSPPSRLRHVEISRPLVRPRHEWELERARLHDPAWDLLPRRAPSDYPLSPSPPRHLPVRHMSRTGHPHWDNLPRASPPRDERTFLAPYDGLAPARHSSDLLNVPLRLRRLPPGVIRLPPPHYVRPRSLSPGHGQCISVPDRVVQRAPLVLGRQPRLERSRPRQSSNVTPPPMINGSTTRSQPPAPRVSNRPQHAAGVEKPARVEPPSDAVPTGAVKEATRAARRSRSREPQKAPARIRDDSKGKLAAQPPRDHAPASARPMESSKDSKPPKRPIPEQALFSDRHRLQPDSKVLTSSNIKQNDMKLKEPAERPSKRAVSPNSLQQFQSWEQSTFQDDKAAETRQPARPQTDAKQATAAGKAAAAKKPDTAAAVLAHAKVSTSQTEPAAQPSRKRAHSPPAADNKQDMQPAKKQASSAAKVKLPQPGDGKVHAEAKPVPASASVAVKAERKAEKQPAQAAKPAKQPPSDAAVKVGIRLDAAKQPGRESNAQPKSSRPPEHHKVDATGKKAADKAAITAHEVQSSPAAASKKLKEERKPEGLSKPAAAPAAQPDAQRKSKARTDSADVPAQGLKADKVEQPGEKRSSQHRRSKEAAAAPQSGKPEASKTPQQLTPATTAPVSASKAKASRAAEDATAKPAQENKQTSLQHRPAEAQARAPSTVKAAAGLPRQSPAVPAKSAAAAADKPQAAPPATAAAAPAGKQQAAEKMQPSSDAFKPSTSALDARSLPDSAAASKQSSRAGSNTQQSPAPASQSRAAQPPVQQQPSDAASQHEPRRRSRPSVSSEVEDARASRAARGRTPEVLPPPPPLPPPPAKPAAEPLAAEPDAGRLGHHKLQLPSDRSQQRELSPARRPHDRRQQHPARSRSRSPRQFSPELRHARRRSPEPGWRDDPRFRPLPYALPPRPRGRTVRLTAADPYGPRRRR